MKKVYAPLIICNRIERRKQILVNSLSVDSFKKTIHFFEKFMGATQVHVSMNVDGFPTHNHHRWQKLLRLQWKTFPTAIVNCIVSLLEQCGHSFTKEAKQGDACQYGYETTAHTKHIDWMFNNLQKRRRIINWLI